MCGCGTFEKPAVAAAAAAVPVQTKAAPTPPPPPAPPAPVALTAEDRSALCIGVTAAGEGDAAAVGSALRTSTEERLAAGGFAVNPTDPDLSVRLIVSTERFDQSGDYEVQAGRLEIAVVRLCDGRILGKTALKARGERQLGHTAALESLSMKLHAAATDWLAAALTPEKAGLTCIRLRVRREGGDRATDGAYAAEFARMVSAVKGIVRCTLESSDYAARRLSYRIVYVKDVIPEGVTACLCATKELGLTPDVH
jgi:hypothetical protein